MINDTITNEDMEQLIKDIRGLNEQLNNRNKQIADLQQVIADMDNGLTFDRYQSRAATTASYPLSEALDYPVLLIAEEAGEVAGALAKFKRGDFDEKELQARHVKELGDVMWGIAMVAAYWGYTLEEIAQANLDKLADRQHRGVIKGSGDNR